MDTAQNRLPEHVAIIMDGNGRWAKAQGKIRLFGHRSGIKSVRSTISYAVKQGIKKLTLFAFSSENWQRPADEVAGLMELFTWALSNEVKSIHQHNVQLRIIGDISRFSPKLQAVIGKAVALTANNTGLVLNIAVNYGGRWDIVQAVRKIIAQADDKLDPAMIDEQLITDNLAECQDVDLLIRTGGEHRISNFLLWQLAYSEIFISETLWPDFSDQIFAQALEYFAQRERRFGRTGEQVRLNQ